VRPNVGLHGARNQGQGARGDELGFGREVDMCAKGGAGDGAGLNGTAGPRVCLHTP
jgi:hypothetical protein